MNFSKILVLLSFLVGSSAYSVETGFFVEPMVGYDIGSFDMSSSISAGDANVSTTQSGSMGGIGLGTRAGMIFNRMVFFGPDFRYGFLNMDNMKGTSSDGSSFSGGGETSMRSLALGPTVGSFIPGLPVRGWVGFYPLQHFNTDSGSLNGSSWRFGAGAVIAKIIAVNAEFATASIHSISTGGTDIELPVTGSITDEDGNSVGSVNVSEPTVKTFYFSMSVPLGGGGF